MHRGSPTPRARVSAAAKATTLQLLCRPHGERAPLFLSKILEHEHRALYNLLDPDLINRLIDRGERSAVFYVTGDGLDVNDAFDLARAQLYLTGRRWLRALRPSNGADFVSR